MADNIQKLRDRAGHLIEIDRYAEAIPLLGKVLGAEPMDYFTNCQMSVCHLGLDDPAGALRFAESAIESYPDDEWAHRLRAVALSNLGRKLEALGSAREANRLDPDEPATLGTLVDVLLKNERAKDAKAVALRLRELAPDIENSHLSLGNVYLDLGDNWNAAQCYREALKIYPQSSLARNNLGVAVMRGEERGYESPFDNKKLSIKDSAGDASIEHFTEAIKLDPSNSLVVQNIRASHSYAYPLYAAVILFPFTVLCFFVAPGWSIGFFLMMLVGVVQQSWHTRRRRRELGAELKVLLKSAKPKTVKQRGREFIESAVGIYKQTWQPHLLVAAAIVICHAPIVERSPTGGRTWNQVVAFVMTIVSFFWIGIRLRG